MQNTILSKTKTPAKKVTYTNCVVGKPSIVAHVACVDDRIVCGMAIFGLQAYWF